jgi:hypothetical protein
MGNYAEHEAQWKSFFQEKSRMMRDRAVQKKEWLLAHKRAERLLQQKYWDRYREKKAEKMEELAEVARQRRAVKFIVSHAQLLRIF